MLRICRAGGIRDEMGGIECAGVRAANSQSVAERLMIEIEHIVLAAMPAEIEDVIEAGVGRGVDEVVGPGAASQRVVAALAFEKVDSAVA